MKSLASVLFLAALAIASPAHAQSSHNNEDLNSISGIQRPTPTPGTGDSSASAKATGPLKVELAKDAKGKSTATTFSPNDNVYLVCANISASKGDKIGVAWYGGKKEKKVYGTESAAPTTGVFTESFNLAPPKGGSPTGAYRVELTLNSKPVKSLKFTVQ